MLFRSEKTIQWLQDHAKGAIGRYQHMPRYIMKRAKDAGYTADTLFTPDVQDAITIKMLETGHGLRDYLSGKQSAESFAAKLAPTWRALPQGPDAAARLGGTKDSTYHDKDRGDNKAGPEGWDNTVASLKSIQAGGSSPTPNATQPTQLSTSPQAPAPQVQQPQSSTRGAISTLPSSLFTLPSPPSSEVATAIVGTGSPDYWEQFQRGDPTTVMSVPSDGVSNNSDISTFFKLRSEGTTSSTGTGPGPGSSETLLSPTNHLWYLRLGAS